MQWFTSAQYKATHPNSEALAMHHGVPEGQNMTLVVCESTLVTLVNKTKWFMKISIKNMCSNQIEDVTLLSLMSAWLKWDMSAKVMDEG